VRLAQLGQGAEQVHCRVALIGITNELGIELLVTGEVDAANLLVIVLKQTEKIAMRNFEH
jgi:hypothetical protein